ncbi:LytTR family DNA-binding domain-containing protein [Leuconostoc fallax]|uniref:LytTR family DNA-binding domain-containing protein n=1 Tax=Leuconostoc fallax TaxID=1251 RepID=UPI0002D714C0|nr:LytTR family DNA-binding domain-containing protein [Leuconostoc fallax]
MYFETLSGSRQIVLVAKHKRIAFNGKMQDIENMDNRFFRSHRGFIVNIDNIEKIDKRNKVVVVRNHATCLISRRKIKALELLL